MIDRESLWDTASFALFTALAGFFAAVEWGVNVGFFVLWVLLAMDNLMVRLAKNWRGRS